MRKHYLIALGICVVYGIAPGYSTARNTKASPAVDAATPGVVHAQLAKRAGEYTTVTKFSMQPGGPASESTGTAKLTVILDGRFLMEEDAGNFMGQPTKGIRIWGYDNGAKQYESSWMYTGSTGIMRLTGNSSDGGKTVKFVATFNDESGAKQTFDAELRFLDDDHFVVGLYARMPDGKPGPTFDTTYTRKR
ncbi:MAG TPA: DUF1579 family protein [Blastocatellia bacterium]|nr:DUF1579 family protein [Blastocatellia bacterium]